jgi:hypothetical protein
VTIQEQGIEKWRKVLCSRLFSNIAVIFLTCSFVVSLFSIASGRSDMKLTITSGKTAYHSGEPVDIEIKLENTGDLPQRINKNFVIHVDLIPHFTDIGTGENLLWLPPPFPLPLTSDSFTLLEPGKNLAISAKALNRLLTVTQESGYPAPGRYAIRFDYYCNTKDFRTGKTFEGWSGSVTSNTLEITIEK